MTDYSAKIRDHLTKQRRQALAIGTGCQYRTEHQGLVLKCAVGCLIPDDKYSAEFEGVSFSALENFYPDDEKTPRRIALGAALPTDLDQYEAQCWQRYHDHSKTIPIDGKDMAFSYVKWCDTDMPDQSPTAFYEALKIHLANQAEYKATRGHR